MSEIKSPFTEQQREVTRKHIQHGVEMFLTPGHAMPAEMRCTKCNKHLYCVNSEQIAYWCSFGAEPKLHEGYSAQETAH